MRNRFDVHLFRIVCFQTAHIEVAGKNKAAAAAAAIQYDNNSKICARGVGIPRKSELRQSLLRHLSDAMTPSPRCYRLLFP